MLYVGYLYQTIKALSMVPIPDHALRLYLECAEVRLRNFISQKIGGPIIYISF